MRIAIVGSGISGLVCARALHGEHDVVVLEADDRIGGHTNTVDVELDGERLAVDTGFIVFNDANYPNFRRLLRELGVASQPTSMSLSVRCDRTGIEYAGSNLGTLFAQRRNALRPSFHRMLWDIVRFNRQAPRLLEELEETSTVREFLDRHRYSRAFADRYLLPMGSAIWSCPRETFERFPMRFIVEFYRNHGLFRLRNRPRWHVVRGGSNTYVRKLVAPFADRIRTGCPVSAVRRTESGVNVVHARGTEDFDEVVLACHSDQALRLLEDPDDVERELLGAFPYSENEAVLHTDTSVLPRRRRAWTSWNYRIPASPSERPTVTYCANILQGLESRHTLCTSLNETNSIDPRAVLATFRYAHPVFTTERNAAQRRHAEVIRRRNTSYCGAYWGNGFHEDGVVSALTVCRAFGVSPFADVEGGEPAENDALLAGAGRDA